MLGTGAKCVTANTAAAVPPPGAGWAGTGSTEVHLSGTQVRGYEPTQPKEQWTRLLLPGSLFKMMHILHFKRVGWTTSTFYR